MHLDVGFSSKDVSLTLSYQQLRLLLRWPGGKQSLKLSVSVLVSLCAQGPSSSTLQLVLLLRLAVNVSLLAWKLGSFCQGHLHYYLTCNSLLLASLSKFSCCDFALPEH